MDDEYEDTEYEAALEKLFSQLKSPVANDRWLAVAGLGQVIFDDRVIDAFLAILKNTDEVKEVRETVASSFSEVREERVVTALIEILNDACPEVKASAAWSLGEIGDKRALPALVQLEENDKSELENGFPVSEAASEAIASIKATNN